MIKLILRQFYRHRFGLIVIAFVWMIVGVLLYEYRNPMLSTISRWFSGTPDAGEEMPERAYYQYVKPAMERIDQGDADFFCKQFTCSEEELRERRVRLDMMTKTCQKIGAVVPDDFSVYRPDWIDQLKEWNLNAKSARDTDSRNANIIDPQHYWKRNQKLVFQSLKDAVNALSYAYKIPASVHGKKNEGPIYIPELIQKYASAICEPVTGTLAWGDYVQFLEVAAYRKHQKDTDEFAVYPMEKELLILSSLKKNPDYILALRNYSAGGVFNPDQESACSKNAAPTLACISAEESVRIYNRLLYFSGEESLPGLYLSLGRLHRILSKRSDKLKHIESALNYYEGATHFAETEQEALVSIVRLYIQVKDFDSAYSALKLLSLRTRDKGNTDSEFRLLARETLMGLGRFRDADCFSDQARNIYGTRSHCIELRL